MLSQVQVLQFVVFAQLDLAWLCYQSTKTFKSLVELTLISFSQLHPWIMPNIHLDGLQMFCWRL